MAIRQEIKNNTGSGARRHIAQFQKIYIPLFVSAWTVSTSFAQVPVNPKYDAVYRRVFETEWNAAGLQCDITPIPPELGFSLRFETGFTLSLPLSQFDGAHHYGIVVLRVVPQTGQPSYLVSRINFPKARQDGQLRESFLVSEGKYGVDMALVDDSNRICRSNWRIEARGGITPAGFTPETLPAVEPGNRAMVEHLTVLMHVAPSSPQEATLPPGDALKLLGSLSALLERVPARSARLVIFDLGQQRVLLRKDGLTMAELPEVANLIDQARFGSVNYSTLRNPKSAADLLTQLTEEERGQLHASDALVFLGLHMQTPGSLRGRIAGSSRGGPRIFYLECRPPIAASSVERDGDLDMAVTPSMKSTVSPVNASQDDADPPSDKDLEAGPSDVDRFSAADAQDSTNELSSVDQPDQVDASSSATETDQVDGPSPSEQPDVIEHLVKRLKGETITIRSPNDCARALRRMAKKISEANTHQ